MKESKLQKYIGINFGRGIPPDAGLRTFVAATLGRDCFYALLTS
ncbi:hypothetical protein PPIS_a4344 [Pseudoalteromonas piscicida]|uniref:Uncharacterized protein n=1 Tax=Pseudoalteromonas piscicida TaxID=43662 RepID=A0ABM6NJV4_PSEO7|nr:hypothetical protein PPIS_a4344 [Pseudoalteromonas piscicida]